MVWRSKSSSVGKNFAVPQHKHKSSKASSAPYLPGQSGTNPPLRDTPLLLRTPWERVTNIQASSATTATACSYRLSSPASGDRAPRAFPEGPSRRARVALRKFLPATSWTCTIGAVDSCLTTSVFASGTQDGANACIVIRTSRSGSPGRQGPRDGSVEQTWQYVRGMC